MSTLVKLKQFEGPFELLLNLIDEQKLDVSEISISEVTEQFMEYIDNLEKNRAEELADFLVVATRLLLLKSRLLLPQFTPETAEGPSLEDQLRLYKMFRDASKAINDMWLSSACSKFRIEPVRISDGFIPPSNVSLENLHESMVKLISRLKPPRPLPSTHIDKAISMKKKIDEIRKMLGRKKKISFSEVLQKAENKTEVIVGFLALLELVKQKHIYLHQNESYSDITLEKV